MAEFSQAAFEQHEVLLRYEDGACRSVLAQVWYVTDAIPPNLETALLEAAGAIRTCASTDPSPRIRLAALQHAVFISVEMEGASRALMCMSDMHE